MSLVVQGLRLSVTEEGVKREIGGENMGVTYF